MSYIDNNSVSEINKDAEDLSSGGGLRIGVWGDSLLLGVILDEAAGRYRILKENAVSMCGQVLRATIENFSKFGCTVEKGKQRLLQSLSRGKHCDVALLEYGGNDCDMPWADIAANPEHLHEPKVPLAAFASQIQEMIDALKQHGIIPLLTTLPPLQPERYLDWICRDGLSREKILKFLGDTHRIYRHHERYSLEVTRLAMENNCKLIDVRAAFLDRGDYHKLMCRDGIHPNEKGQQLIRETFVAYANKHLPGLALA